MFKSFGGFLFIIGLCSGKDLRTNDLTEAELNTLVTLHCIDHCIDKKLQAEPNLIEPKADKDWYSFSRNDDYFDVNGTVTTFALEKAQNLCNIITTYSLPSWRICTKKCKKFNSIIALSALNYAETYLVTSCSNPERFIYANKCLNKFRAIEKQQSNYEILISQSNKNEQSGPNGIICQNYVNVILNYGKELKECGWNTKMLISMINNKLAHSSYFHKVSFTPYEQCYGAIIEL